MAKKTSNIKINQIVPFGFGTILVVMGFTTAVNQWSQSKLVESQTWVAEAYQIEGEIKGLTKSLFDTISAQRGFVTSKQEKFLQAYQESLEGYKRRENRVRNLIGEDTERIEKVELVLLEIDRLFKILDEIILLTQQGAANEDQQALFQQQSSIINVQLSSVLEEEINIRTQYLENSARQQRIATIINWSGWVICIAVGIFVSYFVANSIIKPIKERASEVAVAANEIAVTIEQQQQTVNNQVGHVNQTTTTMDELGSATVVFSEQAQSSSNGAHQALKLAEEGTISVEQALSSMDTLRNQVNQISKQISNLSEQTGQIGSISKLVADIASQTNMLALNASVEAVRAGEQGKGFKLVASEIRKLADETKKSADRINTLTKNIQAAMNSSIMVTDQGTKGATHTMTLAHSMSQAFLGVRDSIDNVVENSQQISLVVQQQTVAVEQVIAAMNEVNSGASETSTGIEQLRENINQLSLTSKQLFQII